MRSYKIQIGQETRLVVHDRGLPPTWKQTNIDKETEERAMEKWKHNCVVHLNPQTFEVLACLPIR